MEELYTKRFQNLETAVKRSLKQMQTDGLARQLEMHRTSCTFAPRRLLEVLSDNIESNREKFIQQLLHEIDNSVFDRDKVELKIQKIKSQQLSTSKNVKEENKKLKQLEITINNQINEIQKKQAHRDSRYEKAISIRDAEIRGSQLLCAKTKSILSVLTTDLTDLRVQISMYSSSSQRALKSSCNKIKVESKRWLTDLNDEQEMKMTSAISSKKSQFESIKKSNTNLQNSYNSIANYLNEVSAASSLSTKITDSQSLEKSFAQILEAKANEAIKYHLKQASIELNGVKLERSTYCSSVTNYVNEALRKREKELNDIIAQARQRRHKLKADLAAAQEQIKALSGSKISGEGDSMKEFEKSNVELESATHMLDMTMSQLGLGPETRKSKIPVE